MRRVVVTGMGMITALGCGINDNWKNLISGKSGIKKIDSFTTEDLPSQIGGIIPENIIDDNFSEKDKRKMDKFILYSLIATNEAIQNSGWIASDENDAARTGVIIGSGIGGLATIYDNSIILEKSSPRKISPFFIPSSLINLASGQVSIKHNFKGPNHSTVTACASGAHAIGDSFRLIQLDKADVMVAGGAEAAICRLGIAGFCALRALSTKFNDKPIDASRPFDEERDGFVMGDGAGTLILEEYEHAKKRKANILAEVIGYGSSGDAYHITAPPDDGNGAERCVISALDDAKVNTEDIEYINAHGTSTPVGDKIEVKSIKKIFSKNLKKIKMSSTKSSIGHLLGASGSVESIYSILSILKGQLPPTLNLRSPISEASELDLIPLSSIDHKINYALSNSFGFGGTNASLIFKSI
ncbi:MAG: beta-ketoacyl-[acyl-carrier-protein] synthase II [Pelagibacteraceae bacterium]|nr:beta-ketoacyl-[acyl-carrier-protein] synthase II [Pelagibacteraceae bacterium]